MLVIPTVHTVHTSWNVSAMKLRKNKDEELTTNGINDIKTILVGKPEGRSQITRPRFR